MNFETPESVAEEWEVGDVILNRYEVRQKFEGGGMGLVYRVYHGEWDIEMAVKSPRSNFFQTTEQVENFEREAETWVNLGLHPHIVSCYYVRRLGHVPRIFSEFVEGGTLSEWIRDGRLYEGGKDKALQRVVDVAIQVAWGLHYSHEKGLVHQDVKPGNVLMMSDGTAKISDFGLARARGSDPEGSTSNRASGHSIFVRGSGYLTPEYASPEQFRGDPLTRSSDIWSWAVMVLELLTGECRWRDGRFAPEVLMEFYGSAPNFDPLGRLLEKCLQKVPADRPNDFGAVADELKAIWRATGAGEYFRTLPEGELMEMASINNRAVSLLELDHQFDADTVKSGWSLFNDLLERFPLNKTVRLNCALFRWLHCGGPIKDLDREIDMIQQLPGPPIGPDWLIRVELAKLDTRRAFSIPHRSAVSDEAISVLHSAMKEHFQSLFEEAGKRSESSACHGQQFTLRSAELTESRRDLMALEQNAATCEAFLEVQRYPQAKVIARRYGSSQPIFERDYPNRYYTAAALDETESIIVIVQIKVDKEDALEKREDNKIAVEVISLATGDTLFYDEDSYNRREELRAIEEGGCAITIDSLVHWIQIWIFSCSSWAVRRGVRRILILPNNEGPRWFHDFRHIAPCNSDSSIFRLSGDGRHLLAATPYSAELWEVQDGVPHAQLADVEFCDFGLIRRDDSLKGFVLEPGFEFEVSEVCGYAVLDTLRRFDFVRRGLLAVIAPGGFDDVSGQQRMYQDALSALPLQCDVEFIHNGVALFDAVMESPVADMSDLLNRRWAWTSSFPARVGIKAWHVRTHDEYWARPVYWLQSRAADEFIFLRNGAFPEFTCEPLRCFAQHIVRNKGKHKNFISLGPVSSNGHLTMRPLTDRSDKAPSRVELHQMDVKLQSEEPICWLDVDCSVYEQMNGARLVGVTDLAIFAKTGANEVSIVRTDDAAGLTQISLDASITGIYPVLDDNGRSCKCIVSTYKPFQLVSVLGDGSFSILSTAKIASSGFSVRAASTNGLTFVLEKTNAEIVVVSNLAVEWRETRIWTPFECFASWVEFRQRAQGGIFSDLLFTPYGWTLSHCGRLLACICDTWLLVLDVPDRRCVLKWNLPGQGVKSMGFDLSGRWLALTHSGNVWEEFEVMWNPVRSDDSATQPPERAR